MVRNSMGALNAASLDRFLEGIRILRDVTGNEQMRAQSLMMFLFIAKRHPGEVAMGEIEKTLGLNQSLVSRNLQYLSAGNVGGHPGYGLVTTFADPFYLKRKMCKLTQRGYDTAAQLSLLMGN